jgi:hypothetical protein
MGNDSPLRLAGVGSSRARSWNDNDFRSNAERRVYHVAGIRRPNRKSRFVHLARPELMLEIEAIAVVAP